MLPLSFWCTCVVVLSLLVLVGVIVVAAAVAFCYWSAWLSNCVQLVPVVVAAVVVVDVAVVGAADSELSLV